MPLDVASTLLKLRHSVIAELVLCDSASRVIDSVWSEIESLAPGSTVTAGLEMQPGPALGEGSWERESWEELGTGAGEDGAGYRHCAGGLGMLVNWEEESVWAGGESQP